MTSSVSLAFAFAKIRNNDNSNIEKNDKKVTTNDNRFTMIICIIQRYFRCWLTNKYEIDIFLLTTASG